MEVPTWALVDMREKSGVRINVLLIIPFKVAALMLLHWREILERTSIFSLCTDRISVRVIRKTNHALYVFTLPHDQIICNQDLWAF